ncbi:hypothetical protein T265_07343 [Opisthorchis viverrini]|uniref:Uncharacterized protein n=1 Tax=Opisthorchis viverrini TaxID=6198 RepID=A0A074ZD56_OPIVI|nr:hypothetical protein T265_07343 [Opisthorchis viverrini]KER25118.1 hypothetical protein T265_07343 [Opisthorchis viverrini]
MYRDNSNIVATGTLGGLVQHIQLLKNEEFSWIPEYKQVFNFTDEVSEISIWHGSIDIMDVVLAAEMFGISR